MISWDSATCPTLLPCPCPCPCLTPGHKLRSRLLIKPRAMRCIAADLESGGWAVCRRSPVRDCGEESVNGYHVMTWSSLIWGNKWQTKFSMHGKTFRLNWYFLLILSYVIAFFGLNRQTMTASESNRFLRMSAAAAARYEWCPADPRRRGAEPVSPGSELLGTVDCHRQHRQH